MANGLGEIFLSVLSRLLDGIRVSKILKLRQNFWEKKSLEFKWPMDWVGEKNGPGRIDGYWGKEMNLMNLRIEKIESKE